METLRYKHRAPSHPGALLREVVLPELEITQGEFANLLGVSRRTVSEILHERRPVTPDMAIRLGKVLGNGAGLWLRMQQEVDVWTLEQEGDYGHIHQLKPKKTFDKATFLTRIAKLHASMPMTAPIVETMRQEARY